MVSFKDLIICDDLSLIKEKLCKIRPEYFDFGKYQDTDTEMYGVLCKTEEEANEFCLLMHKNGMHWNSDESYITTDRNGNQKFNNHFKQESNGVVYFFNVGKICSYDYYIRYQNNISNKTPIVIEYSEIINSSGTGE